MSAPRNDEPEECSFCDVEEPAIAARTGAVAACIDCIGWAEIATLCEVGAWDE